MGSKNKQKNKKFSLTLFILKAVLVFLMVSMLIRLVANEVTLATKKEELATVEAQVIAQLADNEELSLLMQSSETEIVARVAREEYDYALPNERVFVDMSGK